MSKKKRRFRFTTRTLFTVVTLFAILFAIFGARAVREGRERIALAEISRLGGRYDRLHVRSLERNGWLSRGMSMLLYEHFNRVTHLSLDGTEIVDDDLAVLASLTYLEGLDISDNEVTDAVVPILASLPRLKCVNLHNTKLTESGVRKLKEHHASLTVYR